MTLHRVEDRHLDHGAVPRQDTGVVGHQQRTAVRGQVLHAAHLDAPVAAGDDPEQRQQGLGELAVEAEVVHVELAVGVLLAERGEPVVDADQLLEGLQVDDVPAGQFAQLDGQRPGGAHGGGGQVATESCQRRQAGEWWE